MKNPDSFNSSNGLTPVKKVAICFAPQSLSREVLHALPLAQTSGFAFSFEYAGADFVVSNHDEILLKAMEEGKEAIQIRSDLPLQKIVDRLIHKFKLE